VKDLLDTKNVVYIFDVSDLNKSIQLLNEKNLIKDVDYQIDNNKLKILSQKIPAYELNKLFVASGIDVYSFKPQRTLEEFFLEITQGKKQ